MKCSLAAAAAAAATAKSLQLCPTLRPHRRQPTRLPHFWDSSDKNTGVGCHFLLQCMKVKRESEVAQSCPTLATPWTAAYQAPPSMEFSRQEHWSGVPLPSPPHLSSQPERLKCSLQLFLLELFSLAALLFVHLLDAYSSLSFLLRGQLLSELSRPIPETLELHCSL